MDVHRWKHIRTTTTNMYQHRCIFFRGVNRRDMMDRCHSKLDSTLICTIYSGIITETGDHLFLIVLLWKDAGGMLGLLGLIVMA